MKQEIYFPDENSFYSEMGEDTKFIESILSELKTKLRKPSIDEILDKIRDNGMESITQYEKDILDNFGK
jgi:GTP cyclohydrolase FolE2